MSTPNRSMQKPPEREGYSWSRTRVTEQITINVASAVIVGILLALAAVIGSSIGLLFQRFLQYIVIPTNLLAAIAFLSFGVLITLLAIAGLAYLLVRKSIRKYPAAVAEALVGVLAAAAVLDPHCSRQIRRGYGRDTA